MLHTSAFRVRVWGQLLGLRLRGQPENSKTTLGTLAGKL